MYFMYKGGFVHKVHETISITKSWTSGLNAHSVGRRTDWMDNKSIPFIIAVTDLFAGDDLISMGYHIGDHLVQYALWLVGPEYITAILALESLIGEPHVVKWDRCVIQRPD